LDDYIEKAKRLKAYALRRGAPKEVAEDFSQHVIALYLSGSRDHRTSYRYLYADFVDQDTTGFCHGLPEKGTNPKELVYLPKGLTLIDRAIIILYASYGFNLAEVGHILGLDESTVSKHLKRLRLANILAK
jgi:DNA-binding CsgD family transcriptional regulator